MKTQALVSSTSQIPSVGVRTSAHAANAANANSAARASAVAANDSEHVRTSRARRYPLSFVAGGLAVELALFVFAAMVHHTLPGKTSVLADLGIELARDATTYASLAMAITLGLGGLGAVLGRREDALRETSVTDALTHVVNRRGFDDALMREVARAHQAKMPLALLLLDIDRFKALNDELGHQAGDRALQRLGEALRVTCRSRDLPGRLGGDEFVVILPRTTGDEAEVLAERIRETVSSRAWSANLPRPIALSIGVASLEDAWEPTPAALLEAADRALYRAKAEGRDRVSRSERCVRAVTAGASLPPLPRLFPSETGLEELSRLLVCAPPPATCAADANDELARVANVERESCANSNAQSSSNLISGVVSVAEVRKALASITKG